MPHLLLPSVSEDISWLLCTDVHGDAIIEAARGLLSDEQTSKSRKILSDLLLNLEDRSEMETRDEDADWFQGRMSGSCVEMKIPPKTNKFHVIYNPNKSANVQIALSL